MFRPPLRPAPTSPPAPESLVTAWIVGAVIIAVIVGLSLSCSRTVPGAHAPLVYDAPSDSVTLPYCPPGSHQLYIDHVAERRVCQRDQ